MVFHAYTEVIKKVMLLAHPVHSPHAIQLYMYVYRMDRRNFGCRQLGDYTTKASNDCLCDRVIVFFFTFEGNYEKCVIRAYVMQCATAALLVFDLFIVGKY